MDENNETYYINFNGKTYQLTVIEYENISRKIMKVLSKKINKESPNKVQIETGKFIVEA